MAEKETIISLDYELPLERAVKIRGNEDGTFTCTVARGNHGAVMPGLFSVEQCIRWAKDQLVDVENA